MQQVRDGPSPNPASRAAKMVNRDRGTAAAAHALRGRDPSNPSPAPETPAQHLWAWRSPRMRRAWQAAPGAAGRQ